VDIIHIVNVLSGRLLYIFDMAGHAKTGADLGGGGGQEIS